MPDPVFVTGGGGFVGRRLLSALSATGVAVRALDRSGRIDASRVGPGITVARGDLLQPDTYRDAIHGCGVVVHLAASTGAATELEHLTVNARGTELLVEACRCAGVPRVLFVSTIAVGFPDLRRYHYARAKRLAEDAVRASGLRFTILRPAIILGPGAPLRAALDKLARLPVMVIPGNGRARVQPVHVDDVVRAIQCVLDGDRFDNETHDLGGPEILSIEALIQQLRIARTGRMGPVIHLPLPLLTAPLAAAEAMGLVRLLPMTSGQLSSFRWDGVVSARGGLEALPPGGRTVADMCKGDSADPAVDVLDAECRVFTQHLLGREPDAYVVSKYRAAHAEVPRLTAATPFDQTLVAFARVHPVAAHLADAYAAVFARNGVLRAKLVLLLAILETRAPYSRAIDNAVDEPAWRAAVRIVWRGAVALIGLVAGALVLLPARVFLWGRRSGAQ
jgi:NADH dehydrogenase